MPSIKVNGLRANVAGEWDDPVALPALRIHAHHCVRKLALHVRLCKLRQADIVAISVDPHSGVTLMGEGAKHNKAIRADVRFSGQHSDA